MKRPAIAVVICSQAVVRSRLNMQCLHPPTSGGLHALHHRETSPRKMRSLCNITAVLWLGSCI
jgi:hypothetical protein